MPKNTTIGTVGFVGLGDMGAGMAARIAASDFDLLAFDLRDLQTKVETWGGRWAADGAQILRESQVVCVCLYNDKQIRAFVDDERAFHTMSPGSSLIIFSTATPQLMQQLKAEGEEHGVDVITAPISGGHYVAAAGELTLMISGAEEAYLRLQPLWQAIGKEIFYLGEDASLGQIAKLSNNLISLSVNLITQEALAMTKKLGIDEEKMLEVLSPSSGNSWMVENWGVMDRQLFEHPVAAPEHGKNSLWVKDIYTALTLAEEHGITMPGTKALVSEGGQQILEDRYEELKSRQENNLPMPWKD